MTATTCDTHRRLFAAPALVSTPGTTWACVTAKNEEHTISGLVLDLRYLGCEVVVCNDGSTDYTGLFAELSGAQVIHHRESAGIGPSLMQCWQYALERSASQIIQIDAGGSHDPEDAQRMIRRPFDIVVGSRFLEDSYYAGRVWRSVCSRAAALACSLRARLILSDWTSGYRVFTAPAARYLLRQRYTTHMHGWQIEVLAHAIRGGLTISEAPISYIAGDSSFNWRAAREALRVWRKL